MGMDSLRLRCLAVFAVAAAVLAQTGTAFAAMGQPSPWQTGLQEPATEVAEYMHWFHDGLLWIITAIVLLVLALLVYVMVRFNEKKNPVPSRTTHNALLEVAWTILPVLVLVVIAIPSFRLLRVQLVTPPSDITIKATAHQWYWSYEYPQDQGGGFSFDSNLQPDGQPRLLAVDNEVVLPVGKTIRVQVTAADVIHAFAMPSFGLKIDAIPGRLNETWFKADKVGVFHGQCSLICGQNHAFMPIVIRVVSEQEYAAWLAQAKQKFASTSRTPLAVAARGDAVKAE